MANSHRHILSYLLYRNCQVEQVGTSESRKVLYAVRGLEHILGNREATKPPVHPARGKFGRALSAVPVNGPGDRLADVAVLRAQPGLAGPVASGPVIFRLVSALAADGVRLLRVIRTARAVTCERAWAPAGDRHLAATRR